MEKKVVVVIFLYSGLLSPHSVDRRINLSFCQASSRLGNSTASSFPTNFCIRIFWSETANLETRRLSPVSMKEDECSKRNNFILEDLSPIACDDALWVCGLDVLKVTVPGKHEQLHTHTDMTSHPS